MQLACQKFTSIQISHNSKKLFFPKNNIFEINFAICRAKNAFFVVFLSESVSIRKIFF